MPAGDGANIVALLARRQWGGEELAPASELTENILSQPASGHWVTTVLTNGERCMKNLLRCQSCRPWSQRQRLAAGSRHPANGF